MTDLNLMWYKWITEIQAIAQNGLAYSANQFDKERYERLRVVAAEMATYKANRSLEELIDIFSAEKGYATPKIDVRAFILKNNKLLLVKERFEDLWSLPGGWADTNESPSESVIRESKEETGFQVSVIKLLALWDKLKHEHPPQWPHAYKCIFHCEIVSGEPEESFEISDIDFFELDHLPPLSTHRITQRQIEKLYQAVLFPAQTLFD